MQAKLTIVSARHIDDETVEQVSHPFFYSFVNQFHWSPPPLSPIFSTVHVRTPVSGYNRKLFPLQERGSIHGIIICFDARNGVRLCMPKKLNDFHFFFFSSPLPSFSFSILPLFSFNNSSFVNSKGKVVNQIKGNINRLNFYFILHGK